HPDIANAQVFGISDAKFGEEICAWVIARPARCVAPEDVIDYCKGRIAHYKVPRYVRVVDAFITTVTGKAQKFEMRKVTETELRSFKQ
ncbi:MAG: AMP-binding enzyme, partial [Steroidobacteraceae bacterium]